MLGILQVFTHQYSRFFVQLWLPGFNTPDQLHFVHRDINNVHSVLRSKQRRIEVIRFLSSENVSVNGY